MRNWRSGIVFFYVCTILSVLFSFPEPALSGGAVASQRKKAATQKKVIQEQFCQNQNLSPSQKRLLSRYLLQKKKFLIGLQGCLEKIFSPKHQQKSRNGWAKPVSLVKRNLPLSIGKTFLGLSCSPGSEDSHYF